MSDAWPVIDGIDPDLDHALVLADGRRIVWRCYGDPKGTPVIALHGTPGSRLKFSATDAPAHALGQWIVSIDRWGYGATSPHPAPTLSAFADDMLALADHLSLDRVAVLGVSGGGPYAVAVAARLATRVSAVALVAPVGPLAGEAGLVMTPLHQFCFGRLARSPRSVHRVFAAFARLLRFSPEFGVRVANALAPKADRAVLRHTDTRQRLAATFAEGLRPGTMGPVTDLGLFAAPWTIAPADVTAPCRLWLGSADVNVPGDAVRRLAKRLAGAEMVELPGHGHLWVARNYDEVLAWLASQTTSKNANSHLA